MFKRIKRIEADGVGSPGDGQRKTKDDQNYFASDAPLLGLQQ